jgi:uncharacterized protein DUF6705
MKYILFIFLLVITLTTHAQVQTDPEADKFVGTWRWTSGTDTVIIVLEKQVYNIPITGSNAEALVGWHKYVKNGQVIQSSLQYVGRDVNIDSNSTSLDFKTTLNGNTRSSTAVLFRTFWDLTLHKNFELYFSLLPGSTTQATWKLTEPQGIYNGPNGTSGMCTLPKSLTLIKQ